MPREVKNAFVDGISLVSNEETPAVEHAENKFALFKTIEKEKVNKSKWTDIKRDLKCPFIEQ